MEIRTKKMRTAYQIVSVDPEVKPQLEKHRRTQKDGMNWIRKEKDFSSQVVSFWFH
jgi:hypothetical protein